MASLIQYCEHEGCKWNSPPDIAVVRFEVFNGKDGDHTLAMCAHHFVWFYNVWLPNHTFASLGEQWQV